MITHPTAVELARAVAQWIDDVRPQLDQRNAYLARVAMNALAIVDRELSQSEVAKAEATARLSKLLNRSGDYDLLMNDLCERLQSGSVTIETPDLLATLRADTLAKLGIDQPNYRHEKKSQ